MLRLEIESTHDDQAKEYEKVESMPEDIGNITKRREVKVEWKKISFVSRNFPNWNMKENKSERSQNRLFKNDGAIIKV